jgi:thiosulfate reductase cytochrome b subunit
MMRLEKKHPLAIRGFHWINFPVLTIMIWSGLLIYWANDVCRIGLGNVTLLHFFPDWFYGALNLGSRLAEGMAWHFAFIWFFALNGILYVAYTIVSGEWRHLVERAGRRLGEGENAGAPESSLSEEARERIRAAVAQANQDGPK